MITAPRLKVSVAAALFGLGSLGVGTSSAPEAGASAQINFGPTTEITAVRTAREVLGAIRLPSGAVPSSFHSVGSRRAVYLDFYGIEQDSTTNRIRFWTVPMGIDAAARFFERSSVHGLIPRRPTIDVEPNSSGYYLGSVTFASIPFTSSPDPVDSFTRVTFNLLMSPTSTQVTNVLVGVEVYWKPRQPVKMSSSIGA